MDLRASCGNQSLVTKSWPKLCRSQDSSTHLLSKTWWTSFKDIMVMTVWHKSTIFNWSTLPRLPSRGTPSWTHRLRLKPNQCSRKPQPKRLQLKPPSYTRTAQGHRQARLALQTWNNRRFSIKALPKSQAPQRIRMTSDVNHLKARSY
jgi:hypothetical protein